MSSTNEALKGGVPAAGPAKQRIAPESSQQHPSPLRNIRLILRICLSLALVSLATYLLSRVIPVNATTAGFLFLVTILFIATRFGLVEATVASVVAMLCFNFFFLPPTGTFTVAAPQNWVALFAFLATSLTASQLSARAKRRAVEAEQRRGEVEKLYALSRGLLSIDNSQQVSSQVVQQIAVTCDIPAIALYVIGSDEFHSLVMSDDNMAARLRDATAPSAVLRREEDGLIVTPLRLADEPVGSIALGGSALSDAALQSLLNLVAIALERANAQRAVTQAEVARQSEELKSTLLDAIAHEFKTPLTSIKAVTTDLLSGSPSPLPAHQHELISIVDESTDRLSKLVSDAIQLARIEGGTFRLNLGLHLPASLIHGALRQMNSLTDGRTIDVVLPDDLPPVFVDADLIQVVLTHLIDNALKYSSPRKPITVGARLSEQKVIVYVADSGPGISRADQANVFQKFYRGKSHLHLQGTGMGLGIAREILRAHGEDIGLISNSGQGSEFSFGLPLQPDTELP